MGSATSLTSANKGLPDEIFVEGAGSVAANGKFVLRTGAHDFPKKNVAGCGADVWYAKDDKTDCWIGFLESHRKTSQSKHPDKSEWIVFTKQKILYMAPTSDGEITPRWGRWELDGGGAAPAPTVNLQRLPKAFRMTGWKGDDTKNLNGEYLPLDDGSKVMNGRPMFKHNPVVGVWASKDKYRMFWSHGAWRICDKDQLQVDQMQCIAFAETSAIHPTDTASEVVWKGISGVSDFSKDGNVFTICKDVSLATGTSARVYVSTNNGSDVNSVVVRPWFDMVTDLQAKVFSTGTPSQRQQLFCGEDRLHDDGRVMALHGVTSESKIQLVTFDKHELLDGIFDDSSTVGGIRVVGGPPPGESQGCYQGGVFNPADGQIYLSPRNADRAVRFDPATKTWTPFGKTFAATEHLHTCKWTYPAVSSFDNCLYALPLTMRVTQKVLKIDPANDTAEEVGIDIQSLAGNVKDWCWHDAVAGADGCIYGVPCKATSVLRFDPRAPLDSKPFGKVEESVECRKYLAGVLGPSGRYIFCLPLMASRVLCIDTQKDTVEHIGEEFGAVEGDDFISHGKWVGGALAGDGCIYGVPFGACHRVIRIDPRAKTVSLFGPDLRRLADHSAHGWGSVCAGMDGCVYGTPFLVDRVLRIDPFANTVSTVGEAIPANQVNKMYFSAVDTYGAIWFLPHNTPSHLVRLDPGKPRTQLLTKLAQPQHHAVLREGIVDQRCYGPALVVALWREAVRTDGNPAPVCELLDAVAPVLPRVVAESIDKGNGTTARMLLLTISAVLPPQKQDYFFNPTQNTWEWHDAEAKKLGMNLASVTSEKEHGILNSITKGAETWIGGCRKSTSRQPKDKFDSSSQEFKGANDWEWSDGTPFSFTIWDSLEPNNNSNNPSGGEDRVCMKKNVWFDRHSGKRLPGIYRKPRYSPPLEAIRSLVTSRDVLSQCFASSDELRGIILHILELVISLNGRISPAKQQRGPSSNSATGPASYAAGDAALTRPVQQAINTQQVITTHLETEWPRYVAALRAIRRAPAFSSNDKHRITFLSHFVSALIITKNNDWQALPSSADDWSWPPAPLVPLRAAGKLVETLGADTVGTMWPVLADAIATVLVRIVDAVRDETERAVEMLTDVFVRERKSSLDTYSKQLRRARRDPTFPEFKTTAVELKTRMKELHRKQLRVQTTGSFCKLYSTAFAMHKRYNVFLDSLAHKCASAEAIFAPLKGCGRSLEKVVLRSGAADKFKVEGVDTLDAKHMTDLLRGSLKCPDFTEIVFILDMLEMLDVDMGDPKKAKTQGWDLDMFQIRIIHLKDRFNKPTSGGWADVMVNFCFHNDETQHIMELQLQHSQMLVVRKEGKAHAQYNSFRSAFELMEAVGREPHDKFEDTMEDMPLLERLEKEQELMKKQMNELKIENEKQMNELRSENEKQLNQLKLENEALRTRLDKLENMTSLLSIP